MWKLTELIDEILESFGKCIADFTGNIFALTGRIFVYLLWCLPAIIFGVLKLKVLAILWVIFVVGVTLVVIIKRD